MCDLVDRSATTEAQSVACIERADFGAGRLDHLVIQPELDATLTIADRMAID
jgi:hypothetical protein